MSSHPTVNTSIPAYHQHQHQHPHPHPQPQPPAVQNSHQAPPHPPPSPCAPAYSPITPKVQPVLPVPSATQPAFVPPDGGNFTFQPPDPQSQAQAQAQPQQPAKEQPVIPPTEYIPQPPNLPFSSDDASDAIALRAAISTLQFQKKKAQGDIRTLQSLKQLALDDPAHFKTELAAGNVLEQRPKLGDLSAILDQKSDGEDEDEDTTVAGARREKVACGSAAERESSSPHLPAEIPDSQPSQTQSEHKMDVDTAKPFPRIPGPQNVVRMPYVNWEKYGITGEPLDRMHAQQQRWPGTSGTLQSKGREYAIAAPYSPFLDSIDTSQRVEGDDRKDSGAASTTPGGTTISEHPMETRSRS